MIVHKKLLTRNTHLQNHGHRQAKNCWSSARKTLWHSLCVCVKDACSNRCLSFWGYHCTMLTESNRGKLFSIPLTKATHPSLYYYDIQPYFFPYCLNPRRRCADFIYHDALCVNISFLCSNSIILAISITWKKN